MTDEKVIEKGSKTVSRNTLKSKIIKWKNSCENMLADNTALERVSVFNYTKENFEQTLQSISKIIELISFYENEQGESLNAGKTFIAIKSEADAHYSDFMKMARAIFRNDEPVQRTLGLNGSRKTVFGEYALQVMQFYQNAVSNEAILAVFNKRGITKEMLETGMNAMQKAIDYKPIAEKERSDAVNVIEARDAKVDEVYSFMKEFKVFAKIAFRDDSSMLKRLGL